MQNSCDILKQLMAIADPSEILSRYSKDMLEGLEEHPLPDVRQLVLAQVFKICIFNHERILREIFKSATRFYGLSIICHFFFD